MPRRTYPALAATLALVLACVVGCKDERTNLPFVTVLPTGVVRADEATVQYILTSFTGDVINVTALVSRDGGLNFFPVTLAAGSPSLDLVSAAPEGAVRSFRWNVLADLGPGIHRQVVLRLFGQGRGLGMPSDSPLFTVDLSDRLDALASGELGALGEPVAAPLPDGRVWVCGGRRPDGSVSGDGFLFDPATGALVPAPGVSVARFQAGAARLSDGSILMAGGQDGAGAARAEVDRYVPAAGGLGSVAPVGTGLTVARRGAAVAPLPNGRGVVLGGVNGAGSPSDAVEVYDPTLGTGAMRLAFTSALAARSGAAAVALLDGRVLLAGGFDAAGQPLASAALLDAAATSLTASAGQLPQALGELAAVRLPDGRVLFAGGTTSPGADNAAVARAFLYDPASDSFQDTVSPALARRNAGLGVVGGGALLLGGGGAGDAATTAELWEPDTGSWSAVTRPGATPRLDARVVGCGAGEALVVGGQRRPERYTPRAAATIESFDALVGRPRPRAWHTATVISTGEVLLVGGTDGLQTLASVEVYQPLLDRFAARRDLTWARAHHGAAPAGLGPLIGGGVDPSGNLEPHLELYDAFSDRWLPAGTLITPRRDPSLVLLGDGRVLIAGGTDASGQPVASLEVWEPLGFTVTAAGSLPAGQKGQDALLTSGGWTVLGPGEGASGPLGAMQLVDAYLNRTSVALPVPRAGAALADLGGVVLVAGGRDAAGARGEAALLDLRAAPTLLGTTIPLQVARSEQRAVRLFDGRVLLVGGRLGAGGASDQGELYRVGPLGQPEAGSVALTRDPRMNRPRRGFTATLLIEGRVLICGGEDERGVTIGGAELFRP